MLEAVRNLEERISAALALLEEGRADEAKEALAEAHVWALELADELYLRGELEHPLEAGEEA